MVRQRSAKPCTRVRFPFPPLVRIFLTQARLAQRESASLTRKRSLVQSQYRAPRGRTTSLINVHADVAQLVAHHLAKVRVASSSLVIRSGTFSPRYLRGGDATVEWPSGEATVCKTVHTGSIPVSTSGQDLSDPSAFSSAGERFPDTEEVTGSIPVSRTKRTNNLFNQCSCGCSAVGSASPCQGEGREFESRHPLHLKGGSFLRKNDPPFPVPKCLSGSVNDATRCV